MNKTVSKIVTLSFLLFSAIVGITISTLLKVFSGAFGPIAKAMNYDLFKHGLPVALTLALFIYLQFNSKILLWADEVIIEVRKVIWPTPKDTRGITIVVVIMILISSLIVSFFDMFSGFALNQLMK